MQRFGRLQSSIEIRSHSRWRMSILCEAGQSVTITRKKTAKEFCPAMRSNEEIMDFICHHFFKYLRPSLNWRIAIQCARMYRDDVRSAYALFVCLPDCLNNLVKQYIPPREPRINFKQDNIGRFRGLMFEQNITRRLQRSMCSFGNEFVWHFKAGDWD